MTSYFDAWQMALINRDHTLVMLAIIAISLIVSWCLIAWLPVRIRPWIRTIYLWSGIPLYILTLYFSLSK
jgi:hypothetical protein